MKIPFKKEKGPLDKEIEALLDALRGTRIDDHEYDMLMDALKDLTEIKVKTTSKPVDHNVLISSGVSLVSVCVIVWHEYGHAITSKAFSVLTRPKN